MNILLIEDNENIASALSYSFEQKSCTLTVAETAARAAERLKASSPDIIILDVTLPDGNGFTLYEEYIKPMAIPTIFLTARDDEDDVVRGLHSARRTI